MSTLIRPAHRNDSVSLYNISTVPSDATFSWSRFVWPMPTGGAQTHPTVTRGLLTTRFLGELPVKFEDPRVGATALLVPVE